MQDKQQGFIEVVASLLLLATVVGFFWFIGCLRITASEELVSGIVYNNTNNGWISGKTTFSVRAGVDTYVNESNESTYCLPKGSPYIDLVNKAAADKTIKVVVTTSKVFEIVGTPFDCVDNVTVKVAK